MTDDITGIALWGQEIVENLEDELPISAQLRHRIGSWVDGYTDMIGRKGHSGDEETLAAHDRRGYQLSLDLAEELGSTYQIEYHFETSAVREAVRGR